MKAQKAISVILVLASVMLLGCVPSRRTWDGYAQMYEGQPRGPDEVALIRQSEWRMVSSPEHGPVTSWETKVLSVVDESGRRYRVPPGLTAIEVLAGHKYTVECFAEKWVGGHPAGPKSVVKVQTFPGVGTFKTTSQMYYKSRFLDKSHKVFTLNAMPGTVYIPARQGLVDAQDYYPPRYRGKPEGLLESTLAEISRMLEDRLDVGTRYIVDPARVADEFVYLRPKQENRDGLQRYHRRWHCVTKKTVPSHSSFYTADSWEVYRPIELEELERVAWEEGASRGFVPCEWCRPPGWADTPARRPVGHYWEEIRKTGKWITDDNGDGGKLR